MANNRITDEQWYEWTNGTYNSSFGRSFIQQLFRICLFWHGNKAKIQSGITPQEIMAYDQICKTILSGLSNENVADLFRSTRKQGEN